jgi:hypothetical protein
LTAGQKLAKVPTPIDAPSPTSGDHSGRLVGSDAPNARTVAGMVSPSATRIAPPDDDNVAAPISEIESEPQYY